MRITVERTTAVSQSMRARQLEGMFDVPGQAHQTLRWDGELPIEDRSWNVGLIVGPSGSGKSTILREAFGAPYEPDWPDGGAVIDCFPKDARVDEITAACSAVGFNTVPAWLRPWHVLSNGERFRADLARLMTDTPAGDVLVVDEFTSVVDRQVAQIASHAVAKWVRRNDRRLVAASCHYDIVDWLQPDWTLEPATMSFAWRSVQPRPRLDVTISPTDYAAWRLFAPFHYLTADLNKAATCWCLFVGEQPVAFCAVLHQPHARTRNIKRVSRIVTLPDWQGLGLAFVLLDRLGAAYRANGWRFRNYPAHPSFIRAHDRSPHWALTRKPGSYNPQYGPNSRRAGETNWGWAGQGSRPNAVFEYRGPADSEGARRLHVPKFR